MYCDHCNPLLYINTQAPLISNSQKFCLLYLRSKVDGLNKMNKYSCSITIFDQCCSLSFLPFLICLWRINISIVQYIWPQSRVIDLEVWHCLECLPVSKLSTSIVSKIPWHSFQYIPISNTNSLPWPSKPSLAFHPFVSHRSRPNTSLILTVSSSFQHHHVPSERCLFS